MGWLIDQEILKDMPLKDRKSFLAYVCPTCQRTVWVSVLIMRVKCPHCGARFIVPNEAGDLYQSLLEIEEQEIERLKREPLKYDARTIKRIFLLLLDQFFWPIVFTIGAIVFAIVFLR